MISKFLNFVVDYFNKQMKVKLFLKPNFEKFEITKKISCTNPSKLWFCPSFTDQLFTCLYLNLDGSCGHPTNATSILLPKQA